MRLRNKLQICKTTKKLCVIPPINDATKKIFYFKLFTFFINKKKTVIHKYLSFVCFDSFISAQKHLKNEATRIPTETENNAAELVHTDEEKSLIQKCRHLKKEIEIEEKMMGGFEKEIEQLQVLWESEKDKLENMKTTIRNKFIEKEELELQQQNELRVLSSAISLTIFVYVYFIF
ncbi:hypothetical protein RFI_19136 [Reticulomyxa filosa]|uniref:Uncharacterized protein n=1 Tax=Reticulomyxa filosa TaxID=46433 RepID=X6MVX9_RETFI|nr:hypothetical protein RFI_19136 [Reticulomyxa filosa]|eukprot:ETO18153.1 hypothetical protein RFI_19136 [Reticulomyxa filosa]